jgi:hypothetical protein
MWMKTLPRPWTVAMEATIFTAWIYDHLKPHAAAVKVAHPLMLRAIAVAKKKNDRIDAKKIADCLRCDFLPECYMAHDTVLLFKSCVSDHCFAMPLQLHLNRNPLKIGCVNGGDSFNHEFRRGLPRRRGT